MRSLGHSFLSTLHFLLGGHAEYEDLLAYKDGELGPVGRWCVEIHLHHCQLCHRKSEQIEKDLQNFQKIDGLFYSGDLLNLYERLGNLRQAIHGWEARNLLDSESREPSRNHRESDLRRLAKEFDLYFGHRATVAFLFKMKSGDKKQRDPLVEAESVLRDFLGPAAASAVTQRIVHHQASMDRRVQGSPLA